MIFTAFTIPKLLKNRVKQFRHCSIYNKKPPWNVLFFGTDEFSIYSLKSLCNEYKNGILLNKLDVVTNIKGKANPVRKFAENNQLKIHSWPVTLPDNIYDVGLVVSFGHLIPETVIKKFPFGMLNVHASLLPRWRGAAPIIYALAKGDTKTGVTIMRIKPEKFDVGDIITQESVDIPNDMKMPELHKKLGILGAELLLKTIKKLPDALKNAKPQPNKSVLLAPKVTSEFAVIKWDKMTSTEICNLERALTNVFHLTTSWNGIAVKLLNCKVCETLDIISDCRNIKAGFVKYDKVNKTLRIFCANNTWISVEKIGVLGKRIMSATDFNNGYIKKEKDDNRCFK